jgi:hypothetical protein
LPTTHLLFYNRKLQLEENILRKYLPQQYTLLKEVKKSEAAPEQLNKQNITENIVDQEEDEGDEMSPIDCGFIYAMLLITLFPFISADQVKY